MNNDCTFCKIYKNKQGIIYEDTYFFAQFDKFPVTPGHTEIIPKRHIASLFELSNTEWIHLQTTIEKVIQIIEKSNFEKIYKNFIAEPLNKNSIAFCEKMLKHDFLTKKPDAYNIGINEGEAAGRTVPHLHIHIIPRFQGDVKNPIGGIRNIIPGMGDYKNKPTHQQEK